MVGRRPASCATTHLSPPWPAFTDQLPFDQTRNVSGWRCLLCRLPPPGTTIRAPYWAAFMLAANAQASRGGRRREGLTNERTPLPGGWVVTRTLRAASPDKPGFLTFCIYAMCLALRQTISRLSFISGLRHGNRWQLDTRWARGAGRLHTTARRAVCHSISPAFSLRRTYTIQRRRYQLRATAFVNNAVLYGTGARNR